MRVAVVGGGKWGSTLALLLSNRGIPVVLVVRREEQAEEINRNHTNRKYLGEKLLPFSVSASLTLPPDVSTIFVCVPFKHLSSLMENYAEILEGKNVVNCSKGLSKELLTGTQIIRKKAKCATAVLSGPNLAAEILEGKPAATVVASEDEELRLSLLNMFNSPNFRVYMSKDPVGVEVGGALKNVYAIGAGFISSSGLGQNSLGAYITRSLYEMQKIGFRLGANTYSIYGLAGLGDLITSSHPLSRNFSFGKLLGEGKTMEEALKIVASTVEGVSTLKNLHENLSEEDFPILHQLYALVFESKPVRSVLKSLMGRPPKYESLG